MAISISELVLPVDIFPLLLAGAGMVLLAWLAGRFVERDRRRFAVRSLAAPQSPVMDRPLRQGDPANAAFLQDLQGNILNGHGRDLAAHIFVRFAPGASAAARGWIAGFAQEHVRSAYEQFQGSRQFKLLGTDAGIFGHVALSSSGYKALGFDAAQQPKGLNPRGHEDGKGYEEVFGKGLKSRQQILHDPESDAWEDAYKGEIHMLLILAADNKSALESSLFATLAGLKGIAESVHVERGEGLTKQLDPNDKSSVVHVEHFGFVDGRSQPLMLEEQIEAERKNGGTDKWDPTAPLNLVLAPDPLGKPGESFGSFLVYRKLEQDVRGFHKGMYDLARALNVPVELARAMVMGRFQDGTPVATNEKGGSTKVDNNFNFDDDKEGSKCPFHSHIRKANPRSKDPRGAQNQLRHRIARRGIPYGGALVESDRLDDLPETGRGLLFFCYQADIFEQFEFIQRTWSNFPNFPKPDTGLDTVIGQQDPKAPSQAARNWPSGWGKPATCPGVDIAGFVRMKGGEYFFSPSLSFLKGLS